MLTFLARLSFQSLDFLLKATAGQKSSQSTHPCALYRKPELVLLRLFGFPVEVHLVKGLAGTMHKQLLIEVPVHDIAGLAQRVIHFYRSREGLRLNLDKLFPFAV